MMLAMREDRRAGQGATRYARRPARYAALALVDDTLMLFRAFTPLFCLYYLMLLCRAMLCASVTAR